MNDVLHDHDKRKRRPLNIRSLLADISTDVTCVAFAAIIVKPVEIVAFVPGQRVVTVKDVSYTPRPDIPASPACRVFPRQTCSTYTDTRRCAPYTDFRFLEWT